REDDSVLRLERDDDAVQIITMHRSKGLEFEVVFCPFAYGETEKKRASQLLVFHDPAGENRLTLDLGSEKEKAHRALLARETLAEQVRLLYVALTRAMHSCHFVWGRFNQCEVSAAAWLLHRPPTGDDDCVESLRAHMEEMTPEQFTADLAQLCDLAPESVEVMPLPGFDGPTYITPGAESRIAGAPKIFRGSIDREWCVSSFSSLIEGGDAERRDHDKAPTAQDALPVEAPTGIHAFPAGRRAGICLHALFENLDFTDDEAIEPLVQRKLTAFSFDTTDWAQVVTDCVRRTLAAKLPDGFSLKDVPRRSCLPELEFYLPAQRLDSRALQQLLEEEEGTLHFDNKKGWLKGFIDLVFEHEGRFYIVDWKSNRLGANTRAYTTETLAQT
ncbi:MAG: exodeoxyribonuclease V subunit beta, partial [Verrucomicrobiaceae bacterium]